MLSALLQGSGCGCAGKAKGRHQPGHKARTGGRGRQGARDARCTCGAREGSSRAQGEARQVQGAARPAGKRAIVTPLHGMASLGLARRLCGCTVAAAELPSLSWQRAVDEECRSCTRCRRCAHSRRARRILTRLGRRPAPTARRGQSADLRIPIHTTKLVTGRRAATVAGGGVLCATNGHTRLAKPAGGAYAAHRSARTYCDCGLCGDGMGCREQQLLDAKHQIRCEVEASLAQVATQPACLRQPPISSEGVRQTLSVPAVQHRT
jgi:hypothetical protein